MLAIGDELLSGRTKDKNIGHLADMLTLVGIDLREVRIVADDEEAIVDAVNALRSRYNHVFTSGGIGPTHDDITADAISRAFGVECIHDPKAMDLLGAMYERRGMDFTDARKRMARMPAGANSYSQSGVDCARLRRRERLRHGRCAPGVPSDARRAAAEPGDRHADPVPYRSLSLWRGRYRSSAHRGAEEKSRDEHWLLSEIRR
ncbi:competence/damage-inducible protein A [Sinorhizobium medicae]